MFSDSLVFVGEGMEVEITCSPANYIHSQPHGDLSLVRFFVIEIIFWLFNYLKTH